MSKFNLSYHCGIVAGNLAIDQQTRQKMQADFKQIGQCENVVLIVKPVENEKTLQQLRAFHGPILEQIQAFEEASTGHYKTTDRIKYELKERFLEKKKRYYSDGSPVIIKIQHPAKESVTMDWHFEELPSLADLSKDQMRGFIDAILDYYNLSGLHIEVGDLLFPDSEKK